MPTSFEFKQCAIIPRSTGKKAGNLRELRDLIGVVSAGSIAHHMYQYFLKGHVHEYTNDFSHWAGKSLEESALAEHLSNIDPYDFQDIAGLRAALLNALDRYLDAFPEPRQAMAGDAFFFSEALTLVYPAGIRAKNLAEFLMALKYIEGSSLYYHFYDARLRVGIREDDFSKWFDDVLGKQELARSIRAIDPFMHSLESIREHIVEAVERTVRSDMESAGVLS